MITITEASPRWQKELSRYLPLKSLLFLQGNILDLVSYAVRAGDGRESWITGDLEGFLQRYLCDMGYELVVNLDPLNGLGFAEPWMSLLYKRVLDGHPTTVEETERLRKEYNAAPPSRESPPPLRSGGQHYHQLFEEARRVVANTQTPGAVIVYLASHIADASLFIRLLRASKENREVIRQEHRWNNVVILLCNKLNDLPVFLYLNNPRSHCITIDRPDSLARLRFLRSAQRAFHQGEDRPVTPLDVMNQFVTATDGMSFYDLASLVTLSRLESIPLESSRELIQRYKFGIRESEWDKIDSSRLGQAQSFIRRRVKGQEHALARVLDIIKRARMGLSQGGGEANRRPRGVLFFAGPTGVGKTEMAKGLAEFLFGSEERLIRFDMSEYAAPHSDQRLLGAPPGYVGYEEGGQLTNSIRQNPFSVLLFDEIDKAHPSIFDKFLQILEDGRLTDGKGETFYFSECILVFTSNLGIVSLPAQGGSPERHLDASTPYPQLKLTVLEAIRTHFTLTLGRPELLNRIGDNFVIFDFIRPPLDEEITDMLLQQILIPLERERGIQLELTPLARAQLIELARGGLNFGGRGVRNTLDAAFINPLARWLFDHGVERDARLRITALQDHGEFAPTRFELLVEHRP